MPGEKPPVYPEAARADTQANANAFAEFFIQTWDWAYATTNPSYMNHYYVESCGLCQGLADGIDKTAAEGYWYTGGRLQITAVVGSPIAPVTAPADYCSILTVSGTAQAVLSGDNATVTSAPAKDGLRWKLCMKNTASDWTVTYFAGVQ